MSIYISYIVMLCNWVHINNTKSFFYLIKYIFLRFLMGLALKPTLSDICTAILLSI